MSSSSQAGRARFGEPSSRAVKLHANASVVGQELTPRPLLTVVKSLSRRRCSNRRRRWPLLFVGHGHRLAGAGRAAAPVAAAGAWAHDAAGRGVHAGDVVVALDAGADADAGDEEAPVGRDVGAARGVDGDVAGPAQQGAVLQAEDVACLLLPAAHSKIRFRQRLSTLLGCSCHTTLEFSNVLPQIYLPTRYLNSVQLKFDIYIACGGTVGIACVVTIRVHWPL